jgi:hypothetical protein
MPERHVTVTFAFKSKIDELDDVVIAELLDEMRDHSNAVNEDDGTAVEIVGWDDSAIQSEPPSDLLMRATSFLNSHGIIAGTPVILTRAAERYPSAYVNPGERGLVTTIDSTGIMPMVAVRLYSTFNGLAEWQNELHFYLNEENHVYELEGLKVTG